MIIIQLRPGLFGFEIKKGILFGQHKECPMTIMKVGPVGLVFIPSSTESLYREALDGLAKDPDWVVKHVAQIDKARLSAERVARRECKSRWGERMRENEIRLSEVMDESNRLENENRALKRAFEILQRSE